jgi:dTDP-4-dehydrorhamnose 3,5-epimerase
MSEVQLSDLKIISHPQGDLYHAFKKSDLTFKSFGEAYFSSVNFNEVKGWKKHTQMTLNLVVIVGEMRFVIYDETKKSFSEHRLSRGNYKRLTVPPGFWMAFQGVTKGENLLLNIADIEHNPNESVNKNLKEIAYGW